MSSNKQKRFFKRHPKLTLLVMVSLLIFILLGSAEIALRKQGYQPGVIKEYGLITDTLIRSKDELIADSNGIMIVNPEKAQRLAQYIQNPNNSNTDQLYNLAELEETLIPVFNTFQPIYLRDFDNTEFAKAIWRIVKKDSNEQVILDKAMLNYIKSPINREGFRSVSFESYDGDVPKVLLLGDSFTWGGNANPLTKSFSDLLLARGYLTFNTGIPSVDPAQYAAIAQKYIPLLKPDIVIVNFYMGNDQMYYLREPEPYQPLFWETNLGYLQSFQNGCYLSLEEATEHAMQHLQIPFYSEKVNKYFKKTVLTTRLWLLLNRLSNLITTTPTCENEYHKIPQSEIYTDKIQALCDKYHSKMLLVLIPDNYDTEWNEALFEKFLKQAKLNFPNTPYHFLDNITADDFDEGDTHFSNSGHKKYADLLQRLIEQQLDQEVN